MTYRPCADSLEGVNSATPSRPINTRFLLIKSRQTGQTCTKEVVNYYTSPESTKNSIAKLGLDRQLSTLRMLQV